MASEACNAVYKDGRKVLAQCNKLQTKMEAAVLKASQSRARQGRIGCDHQSIFTFPCTG